MALAAAPLMAAGGAGTVAAPAGSLAGPLGSMAGQLGGTDKLLGILGQMLKKKKGDGGQTAQPSMAPVVQKMMQDSYEKGMSAQNLLTQITSKDTTVDKLLRQRMASRTR